MYFSNRVHARSRAIQFGLATMEPIDPRTVGGSDSQISLIRTHSDHVWQ